MLSLIPLYFSRPAEGARGEERSPGEQEGRVEVNSELVGSDGEDP